MSKHQQIQQSRKPDSTSQKQAIPTSQNPVSHPASIIQRARINPKSLTSADVLQLQRTIGNRAVGRLLSEIRNSSTVQQATVQRQEIPEEEEPLQGKMIETIQRQEIPEEEEPLQGKFENKPEGETCPSCTQRQEIPEEEEPLQGKMSETIQRLEPEEEEKLQTKSVVQRQEIPEEEEPLQGKMADPVQRQEIPEEEEPLQGKMIGTVQRQEIPEEEEPLQKKSENSTGMPDNLKSGVESLSGIDMSDVRVHYNSSKPAEVGALAYTQGTNIHVALGQERHLPHEAWHVVQQTQGRVRPTMQLKGVTVNDDAELENEASAMGEKALENTVQLKGESKEEKLLQGKLEPMKRSVSKEEELLQGKWGDFDAKDRIIARKLMRAFNIFIISDEQGRGTYNYELGGVLEALIHEGYNAEQIHSAFPLIPHYFTSLDRARKLIIFLSLGKPVDFALVAVQVCPDDNDKLDQLLDLFQLFYNSRLEVPTLPLAQVCSELLTAGQPALSILNAMQHVADLLTTTLRASAILAHLQVNGTFEEARIAADFAPNDATVLGEALTTLRLLASIPNFSSIDLDKKKALLGEHAHITTDVLRTNAVTVAVAAKDGDSAVQNLQRTRAYGYRIDFFEYSHSRATGLSQKTVDEETVHIREAAEESRSRALMETQPALSSKNQNNLKQPEGSPKHQAAIKALNILAAPKIEVINADESEKLKDLTNVRGPTVYTQEMEACQKYLEKIRFHPDAFLALDAAQGNFELAIRIVSTLLSNPKTRSLFEPCDLIPKEISRLITRLDPGALEMLLSNGITPKHFKAYAGSDNFVDLLLVQTTVKVPFTNIIALVDQLDKFKVYVDNPKEARCLVRLLVNNTPNEVVTMCAAAPEPPIGKMYLLEAIRPKAVSVADLVGILTFCKKAAWTHELITKEFNLLKNMTDIAIIQSVVYSSHLRRFDKSTHSGFSQWLNAVNLLIAAGYLSLVPSGTWSRLSGFPLTDELWYAVMDKNGMVGSFCVHSHPGKIKVDTEHPWGSASHLKPETGGIVRYYNPEQLNFMKIELKPPK